MSKEELRDLILEAEKAGMNNRFIESEKICEEALTAIEKMLASNLLTEKEADSAKAKTMNIRAVLRLMNSDTELAARYAYTARELAEQSGNLVEQVMALGTLGLVHNDLTDFAKSLEYQEQALKIAVVTADPQIITRIKGNLGGLYYHLEKYDESLELFEQMLQSRAAEVNPFAFAALLSNIGSIYQITGKPDEALEYFQRALKINRETNDSNYEPINLNNIGLVCSDKKDFAEAITYYEAAIEIAYKTGNKALQANCYNNIAAAVYAHNNSDSGRERALELSYKAMELASEASDYLSLEKAHRQLSSLYEVANDSTNALKHYKDAHQLEKRYLSAETKKQATLLRHRQNIEQAERDRQVKLARFQEQEKILLNILPTQIAERILEGEKQIADHCENVSVFFSDIVGFTKLSQHKTPAELVSLLNELFTEFDRIAIKHGLEKIKTIGDAYMAVAGVPVAQQNHAERAALFALDVMQWMHDYRTRTGNDLQIRAGLHCGQAVAGVIGENKFAYDLWGDTVNTASRMESHGEAGKVQVSEKFRNLLGDKFQFEDRGEIEVKGKGNMKTYFLTRQ